jgi:4-aminobutyrate aminotransferase-like enzyme
MVGCEFRDASRNPDKAFAKKVQHLALEEGLLLLTCGPWDNTIRFIPPLVVTDSQIDRALDILKISLEKA